MDGRKTHQAWADRVKQQSLAERDVASAEHGEVARQVDQAKRRYQQQVAHRSGVPEVSEAELDECLSTMAKSGARPVDAIQRKYFRVERLRGLIRWVMTLVLRGLHTPRCWELVAIDFDHKGGAWDVQPNWRIFMVSLQLRVLFGKVILLRHGADVRSSNHPMQHGYVRSPVEHLYSLDSVVKLRWKVGQDTAVLCGDLQHAFPRAWKVYVLWRLAVLQLLAPDTWLVLQALLRHGVVVVV